MVTEKSKGFAAYRVRAYDNFGSFSMNTSQHQRFAARPTIYRGIQMRSRLEATTAGLLDEIGIPWKYEPNCFADGAEQYLPDFQLWPQDVRTWYLEVKPESAWVQWPPAPDSEIALALTRMQIIRASEPDAILMLWMPDRECPCGGRIVWHWVDHPDCPDGWAVSSGRPMLSANAEHFRGEHCAVTA